MRSNAEQAERAKLIAANARSQADGFEASLEREPFWRYRRRADLAREAARARNTEATFLELLRQKAPPEGD